MPPEDCGQAGEATLRKCWEQEQWTQTRGFQMLTSWLGIPFLKQNLSWSPECNTELGLIYLKELHQPCSPRNTAWNTQVWMMPWDLGAQTVLSNRRSEAQTSPKSVQRKWKLDTAGMALQKKKKKKQDKSGVWFNVYPTTMNTEQRLQAPERGLPPHLPLRKQSPELCSW